MRNLSGTAGMLLLVSRIFLEAFFYFSVQKGRKTMTNQNSNNQLMDIAIQIEDLGLLYKVDVLDYQKQKETPIGAHIDRVGRIFYQA